MRALIVCQPWIDMILSGKKTWEMRSRPTQARGRIALIQQGSGQVFGVADLLGTEPELRQDQLAATFQRHRLPGASFEDVVRDGWLTPWVLANARRFGTPVAYQHPPGAVAWVSLGPEVVQQIEQQLGPAAEISGSQRLVPVDAGRNDAGRAARSLPASLAKPCGAALVELTGGNLRNNHVYLLGAIHLFPEDAIGGSNRASAASGRVTVSFVPGPSPITTDIDGTKMILRERSPVREFLARSGAEAGDKVRIIRTGERAFEFALEGRD